MHPASQPDLLLPYPARMERAAGRFVLPARPAIFCHTPLAQDAACRRELGGVPGSLHAAAIRFRAAADAPRAHASFAKQGEGYVLRIAPDGIDLWAATGAGRLYGTMTLSQLVRQYGGTLPCMLVGDAPQLARRGVQLCFPQGHTAYRAAYMRHLVPQLARLKINELYLYLESYFDFPSLPHMAGPGAMTPDDALALDRLCLEYGITLIPMLNVLAHCGEILATQRYAHLREYRSGGDQRTVRPFNLCATSKGTQRLVDGMLDDLCACFSADTFHIGGDEVSCLGECPQCMKDGPREPLTLYLQYFDRILKRMTRQGRRGGLWGDMLLHYAPNLSAAEARKVFTSLREHAIIYDWQYSGGSPKSLAFFKKAKLETIACTSTHLCYSSSVWPAQARHQRALFLDAIAAGAAGGMTTAWGNFTGLHEEQFNYLHASTATLLWSGADEEALAGPHDLASFDRAYSLQRYGLRGNAFTRYLHALGDARGPILSLLKPQQGLALRKCLYHTDNPLLFWDHYSAILSKGKTLARYTAAVSAARDLWNKAAAEAHGTADPFFPLHEGPLLMHEHLLARYRMTEEVYHLYDEAARAQYDKPAAFRALLTKAAGRLRAHRTDFGPVETYLALGRKAVGFDLSTLNRVAATKRQLAYLADYLLHLRTSHRPLPAFHELHLMLLTQAETGWYGDREHEWAAESPRFRRYTTTTRTICNSVVADARLEEAVLTPNQSPFVGGWRLSPIMAAKTFAKVPAVGKSRRRLEADRNGFVNVHDVTQGKDGTVCLARRFRIAEAGTWTLQLGHDGGATVYVDGKLVLRRPECVNPATPGRSAIRLNLSRGMHDVVVALDLAHGRGWGMFFQWQCGVKRGAKPFFPEPVD